MKEFAPDRLDVIADEKIEVPVAVVIEKSAAGAPADLFIVDSGLRVRR